LVGNVEEVTEPAEITETILAGEQPVGTDEDLAAV